ncbi:MAG: DNA mismatch repair protein MutS [Phycisphaerales bacterium]|nr:MAG: DNA mismatch repair protein MutS [Phycisphaerales bacterium]
MFPTNTQTGKPAVGAGAKGGDNLTPAMRQYVEQKKRVGDAILLFRMGDFYETFYDDAILCSKVLGIALTSRSKAPDPIPLAGIPYHALDGYLSKLVAAGYKVAISEQLEDPKQAKGVVRRDVVRIVTAGTLTDEALLDERDDNILASICLRSEGVGLAFVELASGRFDVVDVSRDALLDELVRTRPAELLIDDEHGSESHRIAEQLHQVCSTAIARRPLHEFSAYQAERSLTQHFGVTTLAGFGFESITPSLCASGCVIQYLQETQKTTLNHITAIRKRVSSDYLQIDHSSWRSLEIELTLRSGSREGSLLRAIDRTIHPIGSRKLAHWFRAPLTSPAGILTRQDAVGYFVDNELVRTHVRGRLKAMADVERIASRIALARATPRDLSALGKTLTSLPAVASELAESRIAFVAEVTSDFGGLGDIADLLRYAIKEAPPATTREGGFIADGFDEELDRLRGVGRDGKDWLADFQRREVEQTGITSLKVGFNRVFGYYIEIPNSGREKVPPEYVRKQTIKSAERYITDELKKYETEALTAQERACELEVQLFDRVCGEVADKMRELLRVADAIGRVDCVAALAELAVERRYIRPEIADEVGLEITDGRHPVLDQTLGDKFVPNDTLQSGPDSRLFIITGPNMAGKSTYIRQVALLTLLAQTGSFVPAKSMKFSIADRIFARVGASDEIMRGQSTFMVEMTEAANILHNATKRSLVVLDEIGRGTSTFDGLSLAWAITEYLANEIKCRTLVATHYHEMTELAELLRGVRNYNVAVRELPADEASEGGIVFLHRIVEGGTDKSYGVHVAKLAGIPTGVIQRSREILDELQRGFERESRTPQLTRKKTKDDKQMMLFRDPGEEMLEELSNIDPDRMTPLEALEHIKKWKDRYGHRLQR